jgi:hypothetical protein
MLLLWVLAEDDGSSSSSSGSSRLKLEDTDGLLQRQQDLQVRSGVLNCYVQNDLPHHRLAAMDAGSTL